MIQGIREGAERSRKIVRDLRVFARGQDEVWQAVDLHEELESSLSLLNHLLKDRVSVERKFGALPAVECIRSQIDQVFLNLLANAVQAIVGPGTITLQTRLEEGMAVVSVTDTGPGIPADVLDRVFDPFFTTKPVGEGTGLGLSISYEIAKKHGGRPSGREPGRRRREADAAPAPEARVAMTSRRPGAARSTTRCACWTPSRRCSAWSTRCCARTGPTPPFASSPRRVPPSSSAISACPACWAPSCWRAAATSRPDTVRILLTAFTDADALMESINAANIHHFLLKPWDPQGAAPRGARRRRASPAGAGA